MSFEEKRLEEFDRDLAKYASLRTQIERRRMKILEEPYSLSKTLGSGKWEDLTGKRGAAFRGGNMVFILAICEECVQNGWQEKNLPWCGDMCEMRSLKRVVWIAFAPHDTAYGKK